MVSAYDSHNGVTVPFCEYLTTENGSINHEQECTLFQFKFLEICRKFLLALDVKKCCCTWGSYPKVWSQLQDGWEHGLGG